jgi:hypothetical protein
MTGGRDAFIELRYYMLRALIPVCLVFALALPQHAAARSHGATHHSGTTHYSTKVRSSKAVPGVKRDTKGKIARSARAKDQFKHQQPCPSTGKSSGACPGYVIDHVMPLKRGGADAPGNMQWQTTGAAKQKDKYE